MIKAVIFDKDGVIFDTEPCYCASNIYALEKQGIRMGEEEYYECWTRNGGTLEKFLEMKEIKCDIEKIRRDRTQFMRELIRKNLPLIKGADDVVRNIRSAYPTSLVTSSSRESTDFILGLSGLGSYFDPIITAQDVTRTKPHPECFLLAASRLGVESWEAVVIEDAEKGVVAAKRAGMKCIAIPNRYTANNDFSLADVVLNDISKVTLERIRSLNQKA